MATLFEYIISIKDQASAAVVKIDAALNNTRATVNEVVQKSATFQIKLTEAFSKVSAKVKDSVQSQKFLTSSIDELKNKLEGVNKVRFGTVMKSEFDQATKEAKKLEKQIARLEAGVAGGGIGSRIKGWFVDLKSQIPALNAAANPLMAIAVAARGAVKYVSEGVAMHQEQSVAVSKLWQVMRNTMGARQEEIQSVVALTAAQQKLGVVSDNVQLAGAQELGTYLTKKESIEKLLPAMNDMLAQQYGLNATSEQATTIASMLGKVMDGQVGALSRYGYAFDAAQEHILKTGTEAQRAAVLFDVVNSAVGGVNQTLAQTPEGKLKNAAINDQELQERIGKLWTDMKALWMKVDEAKEKVIGSLISWFERNKETIMAIVNGIASVVSAAIGGIFAVFKMVRDGIGWFIDKIKEGNPWIIGLATLIGVVTTALMAQQIWLMAVALWEGIVTLATTGWTAAAAILNAVLALNPVFWIVAGVAALIGVIVYLITMFDGWGAAWDNLMTGLKYAWYGFTGGFKLLWLQTVDAFMRGVEAIERGWYKVKGLWDKDGAAEGLERLRNDAEERSRQMAYQKGLTETYNKISADAFGNVIGKNGLHRNDKTIGGAVNKIKSALLPGMSGVAANGTNAGGGAGANDTAGSREAVATGGTKNTTINITIGKQIESITVMSNNIQEGAMKIRDIIVEEMTRAVAMGGALGG